MADSPTCLDDIDKIAEDLLAEIGREYSIADEETTLDEVSEADTAPTLPRSIYFETGGWNGVVPDVGHGTKQLPTNARNLVDELERLRQVVDDVSGQAKAKQPLLEELDKVATLGPPVTNPPWMEEDRKQAAAEPPTAAPLATIDSDWLFHEHSIQDSPKIKGLRARGISRHVASPQPRQHVEQAPPGKAHAITGALLIVCLSLELGQYLVSNRPSTVLRMVNLILTLSLYAGGVFSKRMVHNPLALLMNRLAAWNVAYVALGLSFFTTPGQQWWEGEVHVVNVVGTCFFPIAVLDSLSVLRSEVRSRNIILEGFVLENVVVYSHLLGLPLLRILLGFDAVAQLYMDYPVAESIYAMSLLSALTVAVASYHVCRVSSGKLEARNYSAVSNVLWGWVHLPGCAFLVGYLNNFLIGTRFYARSLLVFFIGRVLTKLLESSQWLQYKPLERTRRSKHH